MQDLSYTICSNYFFHKSLSKEQRLNGMKWDKPASKGRIMSGILSPASSYSITEFIAEKDFSVNYQPGESQQGGYLMIIHQLTNAGFMQLKTADRIETDYSPRETEMIVLPANKHLTVTYASKTAGKRLEIFVEESQLDALFSGDFVKMLRDEEALYFSNKICDECYEKLEAISRVLFKEAFAITDKIIAARIVTMLTEFNTLAAKR
jgi:hypothetical protein